MRQISLEDFVRTPKTPKNANINPFSPTIMSKSKRKRHASNSEDFFFGDDFEELYKPAPAKQKHLSLCEMSIRRYESEFLELEKLSSGSFGQVVLARHRLDGVDYA